MHKFSVSYQLLFNEVMQDVILPFILIIPIPTIAVRKRRKFLKVVHACLPLGKRLLVTGSQLLAFNESSEHMCAHGAVQLPRKERRLRIRRRYPPLVVKYECCIAPYFFLSHSGFRSFTRSS